MSLKESLEAFLPQKRSCKFHLVVAAMGPEDREAFDAAFNNYGLYTASSLARVLRNEGFEISENMIRFHRRRDCQFCYGSEG